MFDWLQVAAGPYSGTDLDYGQRESGSGEENTDTLIIDNIHNVNINVNDFL